MFLVVHICILKKVHPLTEARQGNFTRTRFRWIAVPSWSHSLQSYQLDCSLHVPAIILLQTQIDQHEHKAKSYNHQTKKGTNIGVKALNGPQKQNNKYDKKPYFSIHSFYSFSCIFNRNIPYKAKPLRKTSDTICDNSSCNLIQK